MSPLAADRDRPVPAERTLWCPRCKLQKRVPRDAMNARCDACGADLLVRPLQVERTR